MISGWLVASFTRPQQHYIYIEALVHSTMTTHTVRFFTNVISGHDWLNVNFRQPNWNPLYTVIIHAHTIILYTQLKSEFYKSRNYCSEHILQKGFSLGAEGIPLQTQHLECQETLQCFLYSLQLCNIWEVWLRIETSLLYLCTQKRWIQLLVRERCCKGAWIWGRATRWLSSSISLVSAGQIKVGGRHLRALPLRSSLS